MLKRLTVKNIALVAQADLEFEPGLSVLTGETGAGKSVIVNALSLTLGARAEKDMIRHGRTDAEVEAHFAFGNGDAGCVVRREVNLEGASKAEIDAQKCTVTELRERILPLAQIMGQHSGQDLLNEEKHIDCLDNFGGLAPLKIPVAELYHSWQKVERELRSLKSRRDQLERERELAQFQFDEITKANIRDGEDAELQNEQRVLDSSRDLMAAAAIIEGILGGDEQSVVDLLASARRELDKMSDIDSSLEGLLKQLDSAAIEIEELRRSVEKYGGSIQDDPTRLEAINERLDELYHLKKKYGGSEAAILKLLAELDSKLSDSPDVDTQIRKVEIEAGRLRDEYTKAACKLTEARQSAAKRLEKLVVKELADLAIAKPGFAIEFVYQPDENGIELNGKRVEPAEHGLETARIMFTANPGEPLKPLARTASGGEISRVLLALKSAEMATVKSSPALLVFDEVDVGIGGQTAVEVGKKLKRLAEKCQVLVITHLHQIARLADNHYVAEKRSEGKNRTVIEVRRLSGGEISAEIARMVALPTSPTA